MKIFGTILGRIADKKLASFDFEKMEDTEHIVHYEHKKRRQYLDILRKAHGPAIIQSYDPDLNDQKGIGNTCYGITRYEAAAAAMKVRSKGW